MIFNIDPDMVVDSISKGLESAAMSVTEETFFKIVETVDKSMPGVVELIVEGMAEHWRAEARNASPWGDKYARAIKTGPGEIYIDEDMIDKKSGKDAAMFVKMVEDGMKSFDIKTALMNSEKAKIGKDGVKYITVPFPVATPRKAGQGTMQTQFGKREMTREMYNTVKSGGSLKSGVLSAGGRDVDVSGLTQYNTRQLHSQYGIFRRVTQNSDGWIHPGVAASPVFPAVLQEVNKRIQQILSDFCENLVKEFSS